MADVRFSDDEVMEILSVVINQIAESAGLSDKDRAMVKRWKSAKLRLGSDDMQDIVSKVNEDFAKNLERRQRSPIRKPDWAD